MTSDDGFNALTERLRARDDDAALRLVHRFTNRLVALARTRLEPLLRLQVDPEDVVQSVYKSFLKRLQAGDCDFDNWDDLWSYLALVTVRKCWDRRHYHRAARREIAREKSFFAADGHCGGGLFVMARDPTPPEAAMLAEMLERLLAERKPHEREILALHLQGFTLAEISERSGYAQRTVRRTVAVARNHLLSEMNLDDSRQDPKPARRPREEGCDV